MTEIRKRLETTQRLQESIWPAAIGYTEAKMYCQWHRQDVEFLLAEVERLGAENEQLDEDYWRAETQRCEMYEQVVELQKGRER